MQASGHRMSTAIDLHLVVTSFCCPATHSPHMWHWLYSGRCYVGWLFVPFTPNNHFFLFIVGTSGKGLQSLYSSPVVKHYFNNITLRDLNSEPRIYQRGASRKVNHMYKCMQRVPICVSLLQRVGRSSVVLKNLERGIVGIPHETIEDLSSNDPSTVLQLLHYTADDDVSPHQGIISQDGELVRSADFIELASCQVWCTIHTEVYQ